MIFYLKIPRNLLLLFSGRILIAITYNLFILYSRDKWEYKQYFNVIIVIVCSWTEIKVHKCTHSAQILCDISESESHTQKQNKKYKK